VAAFRELALVNDVDARAPLCVDDVAYRGTELRIGRLPGPSLERARQGADVRREDLVGAAPHRVPPRGRQSAPPGNGNSTPNELDSPWSSRSGRSSRNRAMPLSVTPVFQTSSRLSSGKLASTSTLASVMPGFE